MRTTPTTTTSNATRAAAPASTSASGTAPPRQIPFGRPMIGEAEQRAVAEVLAQPVLTHGPRVERFEADFAEYTGAPHAVAVSSCTAALHLAYLALGLEPGEEVIMPAVSHVATAHAVVLGGGVPVFADVDPETGNVDLDEVESLIGPHTAAISVVHFLGLPVDMTRVCAIADRHGLFVVEDCALSLGATWKGTHVGLHGDAGAFSFYPIKHITTGEGGMLLTRRGDVAAAAAQQRAFGIDRNVVSKRDVPGMYDVARLGNNYRMTEISAAIGIEQMRRLPEFLGERTRNFGALAEALVGVPGVGAILGDSRGEARSSHYCMSLVPAEDQQSRRAEIVAALAARGVGSSVYYPRPIPAMTYYKSPLKPADKSFPASQRICASIALPVGPHLSAGDAGRIAGAVKDAIA